MSIRTLFIVVLIATINTILFYGGYVVGNRHGQEYGSERYKFLSDIVCFSLSQKASDPEEMKNCMLDAEEMEKNLIKQQEKYGLDYVIFDPSILDQ